MAVTKKKTGVQTIEQIYDSMKDEYKGTFNYEWYKTGNFVLDLVVSSGRGFKPSLNILYGDSKTGKSTMLFKAFVDMLEAYPDKKAVWLDAEHSIAELSLTLGAAQHIYHPDTNPSGRLFIVQVYTVADVMYYSDRFVQDDDILLIGLDSLKALSTEATIADLEEFKDAGGQIGSDAVAQGKLVRKWKHQAQRFGKLMFIIQQTSLKSMGYMAFGFGMAGGKAVEFTPDNTIEIRKGKDITEKRMTFNGLEEVPVGTIIRVTATKARWANPYITIVTNLLYGKGVSNLALLTNWLLQKETTFNGVETTWACRVNNSRYDVIYKDEVLSFIGIQKFADFVRENQEYYLGLLQELGGFTLLSDKEN